MAFEAEGREIAADLTNQYGTLVEARCESKSPWRIVLVFTRGTWEVPSNFIFKFGYGGSGPDCFHAFLQAAGLNVSKSAVENASEGTVLN